MRKLTFILFLSAFLFNACTDDDKIEPDPVFSDGYGVPSQLQTEFGLKNSGIKPESYILGTDTTLIYFSGRRNNKIWIGCYERNSKENLFSWAANEQPDTVVTVDDGYGESSTYMVEHFILTSAYKYNSAYVFNILGKGNIAGEQAGNWSKNITNEVYFIADRTENKLRSEISQKTISQPEIIPWYKNSVLIASVSSSCYTVAGEKLFDAGKPEGEGIYNENYKEYISFTGNGVYSVFKRIDISTQKEIWASERPLGDLRANTRIDEISVSERSDGLRYTFNYTTYDGEKEVRKIKLDPDTGEFIRL